MPCKRLAEYTCLCIPEPNDAIRTATRQRFSIRAKRHTPDPGGMPREQLKFLSSSRIMDPCPNRTRNREKCAIRGIFNFIYPSFTETRFSTLQAGAIAATLEVWNY